ncbi:MAG: hypothetical protein ACLQBA_24625 [Candidatus Binataceae bacterium]
MSTGTQNVSRQSPTTVHELLRNLIELVRIKDTRTKYLASAALENLTRLRAEASMAGFVQWDLLQKTPLTHPDLAASYQSFVAILKELVEALRVPRLRWSPEDPSTQKAIMQVEAAWEALKE